MTAFGAELTLIPSEGGLTTKKLILDMIAAAEKFSQRPHTYWTNQLNNLDSIAGYYPLAEEILDQTNGTGNAFVQCVGTAASSRGVATVLKKYNSKIKVVVVEPAESAVLSGGQQSGYAYGRFRFEIPQHRCLQKIGVSKELIKNIDTQLLGVFIDYLYWPGERVLHHMDLVFVSLRVFTDFDNLSTIVRIGNLHREYSIETAPRKSSCILLCFQVVGVQLNSCKIRVNI